MPAPPPRSPARPSSRPNARGGRTAPPPPKPRAVKPINPRELDELQDLLDRLPAPLEPLDVSMLDGYLCGVLIQPRRVPVTRWMPYVLDVDARPPPAGFDVSRLTGLVLRRHAELDDLIERRQWFDPWLFELADDPDAAGQDDAQDDDYDEDEDEDDPGAGGTDAVYPWVAGFATAHEHFPELMALDPKALTEPLALVYRHLGADDLEDADDLLAEIETLEPPEDLAEAVEGLVRATLLLADIARPVKTPAGR